MKKISEEKKKELLLTQEHYRTLATRLVKMASSITNKSENDLQSSVLVKKKLNSVNLQLSAISYYLHISRLHENLTEIKNEGALSDARKLLSNILTTLESLVTNYCDVPFSDYAENVEQLNFLPFSEKFLLICKLGLIVDMLTEEFSSSSRWKWMFTEIQARFVVIVKNLINIPKMAKSFLDLSSPEHVLAVRYIQLIKRIFPQAIDGYNNRFDFFSRSLDDIRMSANLAAAYARIMAAVADNDEFENAKKKEQYMQEKYEVNFKNKAEQAEKNQLKGER